MSGHSIDLSPDKRRMTFGIFKFNQEAGEEKHYRDETKIDMSKKDVRAMIKDLKDWERVMVD